MLTTKRIALVTGAIGGIGTEISRQLCLDGFYVVGTFRPENKKTAEKWLDSMQTENMNCSIKPVDVTCFDSCQQLFLDVSKTIGPISVLVNNAGITADASFRKMTQEEWCSVIDTNLNSLYNVTKLVFDQMYANGFGRIINISSINGQKGQFGQANYSAAKSGIYGFTKALAFEGARKGVTVNSVSPGYIETEMTKKMPEDVLGNMITQIPIGRLGKPREVAKAVCYLASDDAGFVTGSNLAINGGQHTY